MTLADCLKSAASDTIETALKRYQELRRPRANHVLLMSRGREIQNEPWPRNSKSFARRA
jgi:2-polyprenyl-6-methoxyphenol hydroxylase-like FAD-dependent oxidoreductase